MNGDIEGQSLVFPGSQYGDQNQMGRTGDGKKLGNPLDHGQDKNLEKIH
jgi:hypothetical protein